jgi:lipid-binding SYLF domain-containing protein
MKTIKFFALPLLFSAFFVMTSMTDESKQVERIHASTRVINEFAKMKETIPHDLIADYNGIVIIPRLINASFGIGAKRGKGVAMVRLPDGKWSDPVFVTITGGSIGAQIGVQSVDLVLVFRHKGTLTKVKNGDFTIGGDISAAAGPVGRSGSANTDYKLQAEIYSYSRSRGLFVGISINGSSLSIDKDADHDFYGEGMSSRDIFETGKSTDAAVAELKHTLNAL